VALAKVCIDAHNFIVVATDDSVVTPEIEGKKRDGLPEGADPVGAGRLADASELLKQQIDGLAALGRRVREQALPDELELEATLTFAGMAGIPILASAGAEAGLKLVLKWQGVSKE
jgi:hypothetical protein